MLNHFSAQTLRRGVSLFGCASAAALTMSSVTGNTRSFASADSYVGSTPASFSPPKKIEELFASTAGNKFASLNSPTAGARVQADLPRGENSFQLYSIPTPNGQKAGIMLEEVGIKYDAHVINIMDAEQFSSGFVAVNPNSKIPSAVDFDGAGGKPVYLSESASIVLHLAKKYNCLYPTDPAEQIEAMNWVFWQMSGQGPMCGNFGHFMVYAPDDKAEARTYGIARYGMEVQRLFSVMDLHLKDKSYMVGDKYSFVDIMLFPWVQQMRTGYKHKSGVTAGSLLSIEEKYPNIVAWADRIAQRPAVQRGMKVCKPESWK